MHSPATHLLNFYKINPKDKQSWNNQKTNTIKTGERQYMEKNNEVKANEDSKLVKVEETTTKEASNDTKKDNKTKVKTKVKTKPKTVKYSDDIVTAAIDSGKSQNKITYAYPDENSETGMSYGKFKFDSNVASYDSVSYDPNPPTIVDGEEFSISNYAPAIYQGEGSDEAGITKDHHYHRILVLEALRKINEELLAKTGKNYNKFNVTTGTSLDSHERDKGARVYLTMFDESISAKELEGLDFEEKTAKYIEKFNEVSSKFPSKAYTVEKGLQELEIIINDLIVAPETLSGASTLPIDLEHTFIYDLGGLNKSILPIINKNLRTVYTTTEGMVNLTHSAVRELNRRIDNSSALGGSEKVDYGYVSSVLNSGTSNEVISKALCNFICSHLDKDINMLCNYEEGRFFREKSQLVFIGGGSQTIEPYIEHYYKTTLGTEKELAKKPLVATNSVYANSTGMLNKALREFPIRAKKKAKMLAELETANKEI